MSTQAVLLPLLVQVALTFALGFWMAAMRVQAIRSGKVRRREVALRESNWPPHSAGPFRSGRPPTSTAP